MLKVVVLDATYPSRCMLTFNDAYNMERYGITRVEASIIRRVLIDLCGSLSIGRSYGSVKLSEVHKYIEEHNL